MIEKFIKQGATVAIVMVGGEGIENALGGVVIGVDSEALVIETEGENGRAVAVIMRAQIRAIFLSMMGER